eukprot:374159_1
MSPLVFTLISASLLSMSSGCNYVLAESITKAFMPINVCHGTSFYGYEIYKCESGKVNMYHYQNSDCTGTISETTDVTLNVHECDDAANCPYVKITGWKSCDKTEIDYIETFGVGGECNGNGGKGICSSETATRMTYSSDDNDCTGSVAFDEDFEAGCAVEGRDAGLYAEISCGLEGSESPRIQFGFALMVAVFGLFMN